MLKAANEALTQKFVMCGYVESILLYDVESSTGILSS